MKKISKAIFTMISSVMLLTACGGIQKQQATDYGYDDDTVLWVNADGTDCDYGDYLEGDKDCYKTKSKTYHKLPSKSVLKKAKTLHKSKITTSKPKTIIKKKSTYKPSLKSKVSKNRFSSSRSRRR